MTIPSLAPVATYPLAQASIRAMSVNDNSPDTGAGFAALTTIAVICSRVAGSFGPKRVES